ncbi:hypothetical protein [Tenacibaculum sp. SDUM215027]|uniref:hypothetical protein n=1 Tax=Tenacibaculum sp. SDUM215027 TaxID=3422596 RepID=UPI003D314D39
MNDFNSYDYLVLSPQNLNYELLLNEEAVHENIPKSIIGTVIKLLALNMQFPKNHKLSTFDYKVSLCAKKLHYLYGNDYTRAIDLLMSKFLFRYPYSENNCFNYALNDVTRAFKLEVHKLETKSAKGRGIVQRLRETNKILPKVIERKFQFMIKFFDSKLLNIDLYSSLKLIEKEYDFSIDYSNYLSQFQKIINIHNGSYSFHYNPETDGRFHNSFTFLNKKFRKFLTYDDKKLVEVDIVNSIPTIFSLLLSKSINLNIKEVLNNNIYNYLLMFNKISRNVDIKEIELFKNMSVNGELYEKVSSKFIKKNIGYLIDQYDGYYDGENLIFTEEFDVRKITKQNLLSMLFSKNETYVDMELAFENIFPTIFRFIKELKEVQDYKMFSHLLFQIESEIILEQVARPFNRLNGGRVPIFTIHDCIFTVEGKENILKDFMEDRFVKLFGTKIGLKVKKF